MLTLRSKNIVPEHDAQVEVSYKFKQSRMWVEPLILTGSFMLFFLACSLIVRLDSNATRGLKKSTTEKPTAGNGGGASSSIPVPASPSTSEDKK